MKVIVIGMNPAARSPTKKVIKNSTFDQMNRWFEVSGVNHFSFLNCFDEPGVAPKMSMVDWDRFQYVDNEYRVLALGGFASTVLNRLGIEHHKLPHPSPRNRLFNDKGYEKTVIKGLKRYLK